MSDNSAKHFEAQEEPENPNGRVVTLSITLHPNGQLEMSGPLQNKVLAYGLLGAAQSQLDELHIVGRIQSMSVARGGLQGLKKRFTGG